MDHHIQQISGEIYDGRQVFRGLDDGKFISRAEVVEIWKQMLNEPEYEVEIPTQKVIAPTSPFHPEPLMYERVMRPYLDSDARPLGGFAELNTDLAYKVAIGDETDWNNLVQTLRDAVKNDAIRRGVSVRDRLKTFETYAAKKYKKLNGIVVSVGTIATSTQVADSVAPVLRISKDRLSNKNKKKTKTAVAAASIALSGLGWLIQKRKRI